MKDNDLQSKLNEIDSTLDTEDLAALDRELNQYLVKYPDDNMVDATIDTLRQYVPEKNKQTVNYLERAATLIRRAGTEITIIHKAYWIVSTILFTLGYFITTYAAYNPVLTLVILAPLPFVFGLLEVFKGRDQGVLEMEMACKYSAHEVMLSRMFLIGVYNVGLNTLLTFTIFSTMNVALLLEVIIIWLTPFSLFVSVALWLSMRFHGPVFLSSFLCLWGLFSFVLSTNAMWMERILHLHGVFHFVFLGIGFLMVVVQMKQFLRNYTSFEGDGTIETSY